MTTSFSRLKAAQGKFRDCGVSVRDGLGRDEGRLGFFFVVVRDGEGEGEGERGSGGIVGSR